MIGSKVKTACWWIFSGDKISSWRVAGAALSRFCYQSTNVVKHDKFYWKTSLRKQKKVFFLKKVSFCVHLISFVRENRHNEMKIKNMSVIRPCHRASVLRFMQSFVWCDKFCLPINVINYLIYSEIIPNHTHNVI